MCLTSEYRNKSSEWLLWIFGLICPNSSDVEKCVAAGLFSIIVRNNRIVKYADYLLDNYIEETAPFLFKFCLLQQQN